jgi:2-dehydropantoate 2-reductase
VAVEAATRLDHPVDVCLVTVKAAQLEAAVRDDEAATLWSKLAVLAPIALLTTWTAAPIGEARAGHRDELVAVVHEIVLAARADGVDLDETATVAILEAIPDGMRSSMQKDAAAGRPIELDAIGGTILRAAARAGTDAPVTARLVADLRQRYG